MKFVLRSVRDSCRLGTLAVNGSEVELETPLCFLYTRAGSVPYITKDLLSKIENIPSIAAMPLTLLAENQKIVEKFGGGIAKFTSMQEKLIFCTVQDPAQPVPTGYNDTAGVSLWGRGGKLKINEEVYMKTIKSFRPHLFQALCDSDTCTTSSRKRVRKSVDRTLGYLDRCLESLTENETAGCGEVFGVVEGGFFSDERCRSAKETATRSVAGFSVEGFYNFGLPPADLTVTSISDLLQQTLKHLPEDKPRHLPGSWSPLDIVQAVRLGFDLFDSSYPYTVTERNAALIFHWDKHLSGKTENQDGAKTDSIESAEPTDQPAEIGLADKKCFADSQPLLVGCTCYTCTNHKRAYIHHLIVTSELLAGVLLMIHNFHHYFSFIRGIREAIQDGRIQELEQELRSQKFFIPVPATDDQKKPETKGEVVERA